MNALSRKQARQIFDWLKVGGEVGAGVVSYNTQYKLWLDESPNRAAGARWFWILEP